MSSMHETLIGIAALSQRLVNALDRCVGRKTIESSRLDKIFVGSRTVLEALTRTTLLKDGNADDRLVDWIKSEEPQACLRTLNQMEEILNRKVEHGVKSFFKASHAEDKGSEAIRLFHMRKSYFHFLLSADIWDRGSGIQKKSNSMTQRNVHQISQELRDGRNSAPAPSCEGVGSRNMSVINPKAKQEIDLGKLGRILEWLNAYSSREIHERTIQLRQPDTCTWLPNTPQYKKWWNMDSSFLWLHGKPGAGKSVLAASMINGLKSTLRDGEALVFFYCDFRNERSTTAVEVMRSILSQLLQQFRRHKVDPGDLVDELIEERDEGASTITNVMLLARYISRAAKRFSSELFLIIDALDECRDVEILLKALMELRKAYIRLFVTSRPLSVIRDAFLGLPSISMDVMQHAVSADIELHTRRELDSHRRLRVLDPSLKEEIYSALCERADGMFRLVQCQLDTLKRCATAARIREALKNLPKDLHVTYERILLQINEEDKKIARRALGWLLFSLAPLELAQIMEILSINLGQRILDRDSGPVHGSALLDALGSLVMYDEMTDIVILSHFSVKEYLMAESTRIKHPGYHIDERDARAQLALICICYISIYLEPSQKSGNYRTLQSNPGLEICHEGLDMAISTRGLGPPASPFESHPFLEYVLVHGFNHLEHVRGRFAAVLRAIKALQVVVQRHPSQWELLCQRRPFPPWPALKHDFVLYILIVFAPEGLLRSFIGRDTLWLKDKTNPLTYAARFHKVGHARALLSAGVNLDRRGWDIYGSRLLLPLEVAMQSEDTGRAVLDLFLAETRNVPHNLFVSALERRFCVFPACNIARLLQTDEFAEWAAISRSKGLLMRALDPRQYNVFSSPSQQDIDVIQRRLTQIGCDPSARFDETSFRNAVRMGHLATVKQILSLNASLPPSILLDASNNSNSEMIHFLLNIGCNVDAVSLAGDSPLHLIFTQPVRRALESECLKSAQALTGAGCSPCAQNEAGDTPLHLAARHGYASVVEYFFSLPIPSPPDILLAASMSSQASKASMIRLLVHKGANIDAISANGNTPLHIALGSDFGKEYLECTEMLINAGCNPRLPNARGETPIDIAAKYGHLRVVEYLLSMNLLWSPTILFSVITSRCVSSTIPMIKFLVGKGASVHITRPNGDTLLHLAIQNSQGSESESLKKAQILVDAGCSARACNLAGETPFHIAAEKGFISVMEYLLSLGIPVPPDVMLTQWADNYPIATSSQPIFFLLDHGGDIHTVTENGDTLLHLASTLDPEDHALQLTRFLVHSGCNPSTLNSAQLTPLHVAAQSGYTSLIKYFLSLDMVLPPDVLLAVREVRADKIAPTIRCLVDNGANVLAVTTEGDTALHVILIHCFGEEDVLGGVEILVEAGCDPSSQNLAGETPLHVSARRGFTAILDYLRARVPLPHDILFASNRETIPFLVETGVDLRKVADGDTESMCRALGSLQIDEDCQALVEALAELGWDLAVPSSTGETTIHIAAKYNHFLTLKYLRSQDVPLPSDVLFTAVAGHERGLPYKAVPLLRFLIREGANVNIVDSNGDTPLHLVLSCKFLLLPEVNCHWDLIDILLGGGSDPTIRNVDGQTAFDVAAVNGHFFKENFLRLVRKYRRTSS